MKLLIYSDLHLEFGSGFCLPDKTDADLLILAGDIITFGDYSPLGRLLQGGDKPVLFVAGNRTPRADFCPTCAKNSKPQARIARSSNTPATAKPCTNSKPSKNQREKPMHKDFVLYHVHGRLETETFEREQITRDELPDIIRAYMAEENVTYHMILGINGDGVICSPIKDWTPEYPDAFSSLEVVPWSIIQKYKK